MRHTRMTQARMKPWILGVGALVGALGCNDRQAPPDTNTSDPLTRVGAPAPELPVTQIRSLKGIKPTDPSALAKSVRDRPAAIALGKALFWDMQAGSAGQACASCH